ALAVAEAVGVDRDVALSLLATGPLGGAVRRATALGADFSIALAGKDIQLTLDLVSDRSVPVARAAATAVDAAPDQSADPAVLAMKEGTCSSTSRPASPRRSLTATRTWLGSTWPARRSSFSPGRSPWTRRVRSLGTTS